MAVIRVGDGDAVRVTGATRPRRCYSLGLLVESSLGHGNDFAYTRTVGNTCLVKKIKAQIGNVMGHDITRVEFQVWTGQNRPQSYNEVLTWQPLIPCYLTGGNLNIWTIGGSLNVIEACPEILLEGEERRFAISSSDGSVNGSQITTTIDLEEL